ncbi:MAG: tetratricopeptide repeat protein [Rhodobiaceae bacterium]|nr:tetratricopeptide repeat protein [Rhodobiaceae bacterium]
MENLVSTQTALLDSVKRGKAVLFLGAGASIGGIDGGGGKIPDANGLARKICDRFLSDGYLDSDFTTTYDLACTEAGVRDVQAFIHDELNPYQPAPHHLLIPKFCWGGIVTTNYDLLIERSYSSVTEKLQDIVPFTMDADNVADKKSANSLLLVKIHGCITKYECTDPPLIANTEQLITHLHGRSSQVDTFLEWAKQNTLIFVGYKFNDPNLRSLYHKIVQDGDKHPPHFIVDPGLLPIAADYWSERRVRPLKCTFEEFLNDLNSAISDNEKKLSLISAPHISTLFSRFITTPGMAESPALSSYLRNDCEVVSDSQSLDVGTASEFYKGSSRGWRLISDNWDANRSITNAITRDQIVPATSKSGPKLVLLKGHAGAGKTVTLKRVAWNAACDLDKLCLFVDTRSALDLDCLEEVFSLTNLPVFLFVDGVVDRVPLLAELMRRAKHRSWPLNVICTERINEWNASCEEVSDYLAYEYELSRLSETEVDDLIAKLERADCLGELKVLPAEERRNQFLKAFDRQLLVALHEATHGASLRDILRDEYNSIPSYEARLLYLDVCSLYRFGAPVRAGLISRVHNISFEEFEKRFFDPLDSVVMREKDPRSGDFVFRARHPLIADIVVSEILKTSEERFENISRIIDKLNSAFSYDLRILHRLLKWSELDRLLSDASKVRVIYQKTMDHLGNDPYVLHQWGLYEMHKANDKVALSTAENFLRQAVELEPKATSFRHSLAELALRKSRLATNSMEKDAFRQEAIGLASDLARTSKFSHSYHTLAKVRLDTLTELLGTKNDTLTEGDARLIQEAIKECESTIRAGLDRFPNDPHLLGSEAELSKALLDVGRALNALRKAFEGNPASELIARRLVRVLLSQKQTAEARGVLTKAIEHTPGSQNLRYMMAELLLKEEDVDDEASREIILYHLKRSFAPNDKLYERQFWYARQLILSGFGPSGMDAFEKLRAIPRPYEMKKKIRGEVRLIADGQLKLYYGKIKKVGPSFCFIEIPSLQVDAFYDQNLEDLTEDQDISCNLGFNFFGPVALNLQQTVI